VSRTDRWRVTAPTVIAMRVGNYQSRGAEAKPPGRVNNVNRLQNLKDQKSVAQNNGGFNSWFNGCFGAVNLTTSAPLGVSSH